MLTMNNQNMSMVSIVCSLIFPVKLSSVSVNKYIFSKLFVQKNSVSMPKRKVQTSITSFSKNSENEETESKKLKVTDEQNNKGKSGGGKKTVKGFNRNKEKNIKEGSKPLNRTETDFGNIIFDCQKLSPSGKTSNFKISSWNVVSLKSLTNKSGINFVKHESPDIMCFQETKCSERNVPEEAKLKEYNRYFVSGEKEGYAGVALYSKIKPLTVQYGIGSKEHDNEGRVITAEYENFFLVTAYVPNAGRKLVTLPKRMKWDPVFRSYLTKLNAKKPVILCGDLNVAHKEIDLKNPSTNTRTAGFTQEERDGFTALLKEGFVDSFRKLYPNKEGAYTYWNYIGNARSRNAGWRLDYFVLSEKLMDSVCDNIIRSEVYGSDHCPITLFMSI